MKFGFNDRCLDHDTGPRHPENPDRLRAIKEGLKGEHDVEYIESEPIEPSVAEGVHDDEYLDTLEAFCDDGGGQWDPDTVVVEASWEAALASAGLSCWVAETAMAGANGRETPFALGRPPGHHAIVDDAMGFCLINNVAVAAEQVIQAGNADRVAIFDWDVHHGNGTQDIFYEREDVLLVSIHEAGLYPGTGAIDETGSGPGEGTTINVPLDAGAGDADYQVILEEVVLPAMSAFDPDLLLVSAGFDAHRHDPISRMRLSTEGYGRLAARLQGFTTERSLPLAFVLEGGYGLDTLAESVRMIHQVFDGLEPMADNTPPADEILSTIEAVRSMHKL